MIRITKQTDYGVVLLNAMSQSTDVLLSTRDLSEGTQIPLPMVQKILKLLTRAELVHSQRGAGGGYRLAREAEAISVAEVIEALEGPIAITECLTEELDHSCQHAQGCSTRGNWNSINLAIRQVLEQFKLSDMQSETLRPQPPAFRFLTTFSSEAMCEHGPREVCAIKGDCSCEATRSN